MPLEQDTTPAQSTHVNYQQFFRRPLADLIIRLAVAVLCNILSHRTFVAMSISEPWWLRHASALAIGGLGVNLVNGSSLVEVNQFVPHLAVFALGWVLDEMLCRFLPSV